MAATTGGALKAYLEGLGLGVPWFRDRPPVGQAHPFGTITEEVSLVVDRRADAGAELVQVDLWQNARWPAGTIRNGVDVSGKVAEDSALVRRLQAGLRAAPLDAAPTLTYQATLEGSVRLTEPDNNVVHHALTVRVHRELEE